MNWHLEAVPGGFARHLAVFLRPGEAVRQSLGSSGGRGHLQDSAEDEMSNTNYLASQKRTVLHDVAVPHEGAIAPNVWTCKVETVNHKSSTSQKERITEENNFTFSPSSKRATMR